MPSPGAFYASGVAAYRAATYETAVDLFTEVRLVPSLPVSSSSSSSSAHLQLSAQAISLAPTSAKLYDARAGAYDKLGRLQDGLIDAREVVKLLPSSHKVRPSRSSPRLAAVSRTSS